MRVVFVILDELQRKEAENQVESYVEQAHRLDPEGNIPINPRLEFNSVSKLLAYLDDKGFVKKSDIISEKG